MANDESSRSLKSISAFKSRLIDGGARANLFEVSLESLPAGVADGGWDAETFSFLCKAAALPATNLSSIDVPFRGRSLKVAGDRTIDPWTITIINDSNMFVRAAMESWIEKITRLSDAAGTANPGAYMGNAKVFQLGRGATVASGIDNPDSHVVLGRYLFQEIFPVNVSQIDVSYDSVDTIEEFTVEFSVNNIISLSQTESSNPSDVNE